MAKTMIEVGGLVNVRKIRVGPALQSLMSQHFLVKLTPAALYGLLSIYLKISHTMSVY